MTYFDARALPLPSDEYVAWVDVMGIQSHMHRSINVAANFMFKLHVAALDSPLKSVRLYPVMDGFYATSPSRQGLEQFLSSVFRQCASAFVGEAKQQFRFVIRGAIAFGSVYHGADVEDSGSKRLAEAPGYRASLVLGPPIVDANLTESDAPPFGIAIHHSAKLSAPVGDVRYTTDWWSWVDAAFDKINFCRELKAYYAWCQANAAVIRYDVRRSLYHEYLSLKYFA